MEGKKRIMIIDDDPDDRYFFREAIKEIGGSLECLEAKHGVEALEQLRNMTHLPDFIFLDLNMPLMDGWESLKEIKKDDKLKNIPVIIYTTSAREEDKNETRDLGAAHFMTKPSDIFKLPEEIRNAMGKAEKTLSYQ